MSPGNYYRDVAYPGGAFSLLSRARWGISLAGSRTNMSFPVDWIGGIDHLPLDTLAESVGFDVPHFQDWLAHPSYDEYWAPLNLEARATEMRTGFGGQMLRGQRLHSVAPGSWRLQHGQ